MKIKDFGEIALKDCDDANIPVECFIQPPEENTDKKWHWVAANYMPRKAVVSESAYEIVADTKEEIIEAVNMYVVPLYKNALENLLKTGELYYWKELK